MATAAAGIADQQIEDGMPSIAIQNDAHWHSLRSQHVGASESPALFGLTPWLTEWQLFMHKSGKLPAPNLDEVKHIKQGRFFESPIAGWAAEKFGITLNKARRYLVDDATPGMGASLDYEQIGTGERIPTEIKWVVRAGDHWDYDGDAIVQAPNYYLVQIQHQIACANARRGQLIAFINGDVRRAVYERRDGVIEAIRGRVRKFWEDVQSDNEPAIDFKADADAVMRYAAVSPVRAVPWSEDMARLAKRAHWMAGFAKRAEEAGDAAKAELAHMMLEAAKRDGANDLDGKVVCEGDGFRVSNSLVPPYIGKLVTDDMVGTRIYARGEYRKVTVSQPKERAPRKKKEIQE